MNANGSAAQKKQLALSLSRMVSGGAADASQLQGQGLPCHVISIACGIVTVAFDVSAGGFTLPQVTCPIAESEYVLLPIQVGDRGFVTSASARLGGVSGLGAGVAPLSKPSNLGGLVFVPIGNKSWTTPDANAVIVQGPNGAVIRTMDGTATVTINHDHIRCDWEGATVTIDTSGITLSSLANTIDGALTINGATTMNGDLTVTGAVAMTGTVALTGNMTISGTLTVAGKNIGLHHHTGGTLAGGVTGNNV
jgi:hypothetical protein